MDVIVKPDRAPARSRVATRRRLVESATPLFANRGLHGVTTHAIAEAAGVAAGTFYLHFRDKEALFREIAREAVGELESELARVTRAAPDFESGVRDRARALLAFADARRDLVRILFGRGQEVPDLAGEILDRFALALGSRVGERITAGRVHPSLDPETTAQATVGMLARVVFWWIDQTDRPDLEVVAATLTRLQLQGTRPEPAAP